MDGVLFIASSLILIEIFLSEIFVLVRSYLLLIPKYLALA